jgi:hypothetical protein
MRSHLPPAVAYRRLRPCPLEFWCRSLWRSGRRLAVPEGSSTPRGLPILSSDR